MSPSPFRRRLGIGLAVFAIVTIVIILCLVALTE